MLREVVGDPEFLCWTQLTDVAGRNLMKDGLMSNKSPPRNAFGAKATGDQGVAVQMELKGVILGRAILLLLLFLLDSFSSPPFGSRCLLSRRIESVTPSVMIVKGGAILVRSVRALMTPESAFHTEALLSTGLGQRVVRHIIIRAPGKKRILRKKIITGI